MGLTEMLPRATATPHLVEPDPQTLQQRALAAGIEAAEAAVEVVLLQALHRQTQQELAAKAGPHMIQVPV